MAVLGIVWLLLLVFELIRGTTPASHAASVTIWIVFTLEFAIRFTLAPRKGAFLRRHWITAFSLLIPAVRILRAARIVRLLRAGRALRGVRVARLLTSFSRGMRSLGTVMQSRGFPYVTLLTTVVLLLGAAGMYAFEREQSETFSNYSTCLWWTAMLLTTMGSEQWPQSAEGRLVCLLLSMYAFAMFGYITATLASFFVGPQTGGDRSSEAGVEAELARLRRELHTLTVKLERG